MNSSWGCDAAEGTQIAALYIREGVIEVFRIILIKPTPTH